jgi:protein-S-isoprenylcysteine O-methyltransferase Ste14
MTGILPRFRLGRLVWTVVVTFYFLVFFRNFMVNALPDGALLPTLFAFGLVLWLAVEYYFGSPFFQSGVVESSSFLRAVFAFFVYPFLGYLGADLIWWKWTQIPLPPVIAWVLGMLLFVAGTWVRVDTLLALVGIARRTEVAKGASASRELTKNRWFKMTRHPRELATLVQITGAALAFNSWGGLILALGIGLPLILAQVLHEDRGLKKFLKGDAKRYFEAVPRFLPRRETPPGS